MPRKTKMNNITNDVLIESICSENKTLLRDFMVYLRSVNRSEGTVTSYKNDIEIAFVWNLKYNDNKPFTEWTKRNVVAYQTWLLNENENSPARVRRLKAALSSLSNYIESVLDDEYPDFRNIINKIESPPNQPVREKTVWTDDDIEGLLDMLISRDEYEKACVVALAAFGGRRKSEICRFRVSDFDEDHLVCDGALYKSDPIKTKGRGTAGKSLNCYTLAKKFKPYLDMWMKYRSDMGIESEWLFPKRGDVSQQIQTSTINSWMRALSKMCGRDVYMHSFRHAFTTYLVRSGLPDNVITQIVGWQSSDMCKVYTDIDTDEQIGMYFKDGEISGGSKTLNDI